MTPQPTISEKSRDDLCGNPPGLPYALPPSGESGAGATSRTWIEMLEEFRAERDELRRRLQLIPRVRQDAAVQIAELEAAHQSIRVARDSLLAQVHGLARSRDEASGHIAELSEYLEEARAKLSLSQHELQALNRTCEELRTQLQQQGDAAAAAESQGHPPGHAAGTDPGNAGADSQCLSKAELAAGLAAAERRIAALDTHIERVREQQREGNFQFNHQLITSEKERGAAVAAVASLQRELGDVLIERDSMRQTIASLETSVARLTAEAAEFSGHADSADLIRAQSREIADLTVQLDAAREETRLAWALRPATRQPEAALAHAVIVEPSSVALDVAATRQAAAGMTSIITAAAESPEPYGHLTALGEQLPVLGQRALCAGWLSIHRLADACSEITRWLVRKPNKLGSMAPLLSEAFSLMEKISSVTDPRIHEDTDGCEVYALDDDVDNCECIAVALDKIGLHTSYATKPDSALREVASRDSRLILLDVKLGGEQTGFDVHASIRKMPRHERTPVLFVTGLSSAARQITEMATEHDSYLAKPYYLNELSLKALTMILQARLSV